MTVDVGSTAQQPRRRRRGVRPSQPTPRSRLVVLAAGVGDVVTSTGGWLADRALAGWDIEVLVPASRLGHTDVLALQILGATVSDLDEALDPTLEAALQTRTAAAVSVSADLFVTDSRVRARVLHAYDRDIAEITVWGQEIPTELTARFSSVEHVSSAAAQAFKRHSLAAIACQTPVSVTEGFCAGARRGIGMDLRPVGEAYATEDGLRGRAGGR
ncbi:MAG: hypothetical protein ABWY45_23680 [Mycobacterium sp.]